MRIILYLQIAIIYAQIQLNSELMKVSSFQTNDGCDIQIEQNLSLQNITYNCDSSQRTILVEGRNQNLTLQLVLQNFTPNISKIIFTNFTELTFSNLILENVDVKLSMEAYFLYIIQSEMIQFNNIQIIGEKESNIQYIAISKNQKVIINNISITYQNGYYSPLNQKKMLIILNMYNNKMIDISNYSFVIGQCDQMQYECNKIASMDFAKTDNITIQNSIIDISYTKYQLKYPTNFQLKIFLFSPGGETFDIKKITFNQIKINLNSLPNLFKFNSLKYPLLQFLHIQEVCINILIIKNINFLVNTLEFQLVENIQIGKIILQDFDLQQISQFISLEQPDLWVISFLNNPNLIKITEINVENCLVYQTYLIFDIKLSNINLSFQIENTSWINTMLYMDFSQSSDIINDITLIIKGSSFKGFGPLLQIISQQDLTLSLDLDIGSEINTQNGLISIIGFYVGTITIQNTTIFVKDQAHLDFGKGGLFQIKDYAFVNINKFDLQSKSNKIFNSQNGGIFQILDAFQVDMRYVTAQNFKINGQGSFAFISTHTIQIHNSQFNGFYSEGSGGTIFVVYKQMLNISNTEISNSYSGYFGGGAYFQNYNLFNLNDNINGFIFRNCQAQIGGAIAYNNYEQRSLGNSDFNFTFENNKATLFGVNFSNPVTKIEFLRFGEYNPSLVETLQVVNKTLQEDNNILSQVIFLNSIEINIIYFMTLQLHFGEEKIIQFKDLNCIQSQNDNSFYFQSNVTNNNFDQVSPKNEYKNKPISLEINNQKCQKNIFKQFSIPPLSPTYSGIQKSDIQYIQSSQNDYRNLLENIQFNTSDFYFLFQVTEYFSSQQTLRYSLFGINLVIQLQKQQECERGQIRVQINSISYCKYCNNFQASLNPNQQTCYKCSSEKYEFCSGYIMKLKKGYYIPQQNFQNASFIVQNNKNLQSRWKSDQNQVRFDTFEKTNQNRNDPKFMLEYINSDQINKRNLQETVFQINDEVFDDSKVQKCYLFPSNCDGGTSTGDDLCYESHVGPFCLDCDRKNQKWNGTYTRNNSFVCTSCSSYSVNLGIIIFIIFIGIVIIAIFDGSIFMAFKNTNSQTQLKERVSLGIHIKYFFFFLQIVNINSFYRQPNILPSTFTFQVYLYNPISNFGFNFFECLLIQSHPDYFSAPHLVLIWQTFIPIIMVISYIILRSIIVFFYFSRKQKIKNSEDNEQQEEKSHTQQYFNNHMFILQLFLLSIYNFNLQIIQGLISGLKCIDFNDIGNFSNIDLTIQCNNPTRMNIVNFIIIPTLIIFLLFPCILVSYLFYKRKDLQQHQIRSQVGFLYSEYSEKYYYWEFVRILIKLLLITCIYTIIPNNSMIGYYVIAVLTFYIGLLLYCKPFITDETYYKENTQGERKKELSHTQREIILIISGMILLFSYMFNDTSSSFEYYSLGSPSSFSIALIGNIQAFAVFLAIIINALKHIILKIIKLCKKRKNE